MRALWGSVAAALAVSLAVDFARGASIPGFYAAFGFAGCIVLIVGSKWIGALLQRDETYYGREDRD